MSQLAPAVQQPRRQSWRLRSASCRMALTEAWNGIVTSMTDWIIVRSSSGEAASRDPLWKQRGDVAKVDAFIYTSFSAANTHPRSRSLMCFFTSLMRLWRGWFITRPHRDRESATSKGEDGPPKIASAEGPSPSEISAVVLARLAVEAALAELALAANADAEEGGIEGAGEVARPPPIGWERTAT